MYLLTCAPIENQRGYHQGSKSVLATVYFEERKLTRIDVCFSRFNWISGRWYRYGHSKEQGRNESDELHVGFY